MCFALFSLYRMPVCTEMPQTSAVPYKVKFPQVLRILFPAWFPFLSKIID